MAQKNFNENDPVLSNELGYNILRIDFKIDEFSDKTVNELNSINSNHLELSNTSWQLLKPDWSEQSTGLDANLLVDGVFEKNLYIRNFEGAFGSYEFMSLLLPIKTEVLKVEGALTKPQFYRDLKIDLSNNKFFDIQQIGINVHDVTNDLNSFSKFDEIFGNKPNTTKDPQNQATILDPNHPYSCYYELRDDQIFIKPENDYKNNYSDVVLKEMFEFDEDVFKNSLKDDPSKVELAIKLQKF